MLIIFHHMSTVYMYNCIHTVPKLNTQIHNVRVPSSKSAKMNRKRASFEEYLDSVPLDDGPWPRNSNSNSISSAKNENTSANDKSIKCWLIRKFLTL